MLVTATPGKDTEDCEIMKHRSDGSNCKIDANASRVAVVNQLARQPPTPSTPTRTTSGRGRTS